MLLKTDKILRYSLSALLFSGICFEIAHALPLHCPDQKNALACSKLDSDQIKLLNETYFTTYFVTDAPLKLIIDTDQVWLRTLRQCKSKVCFNSVADKRTDDLNFYASLNQTLTNHYIKYEDGEISHPFVYLKIHQLSKNKLKIEGTALRNPNNRPETQSVNLLSYTTADKRQEIIDNEHACKYQLNFQKAILKITTQQSGCDRFAGIYRLYD